MRIYIILSLLFISCNSKSTKKDDISLIDVSNDSLLVFSEKSFIKVKNLKNNYIIDTNLKFNSNFKPLIGSNNLMYLESKGSFQCYDLNKEIIKWSFQKSYEVHNYKLFKNYLVLGSKSEGVLVLDSFSGNLLYHFKSITHSLCYTMSAHGFEIDDNKLYISDFDCKNLVCIDLKTGCKVWTFKNKTDGATQFLINKDFIFCGLTVDASGSYDKIYLLDKYKGNLLFEKKEEFDLIVKPLIYKDKIIYYNGQIKQFNFKSKDIKSLVDVSLICQMHLLDDKIYFINDSFNLCVFDLKLNIYSEVKEISGFSNVFKYKGIKFWPTI